MNREQRLLPRKTVSPKTTLSLENQKKCAAMLMMSHLFQSMTSVAEAEKAAPRNVSGVRAAEYIAGAALNKDQEDLLALAKNMSTTCLLLNLIKSRRRSICIKRWGWLFPKCPKPKALL